MEEQIEGRNRTDEYRQMAEMIRQAFREGVDEQLYTAELAEADGLVTWQALLLEHLTSIHALLYSNLVLQADIIRILLGEPPEVDTFTEEE